MSKDILKKVVRANGQTKKKALDRINEILVVGPSLSANQKDINMAVQGAATAFSSFCLREFAPVPDEVRVFMQRSLTDGSIIEHTVRNVVNAVSEHFVQHVCGVRQLQQTNMALPVIIASEVRAQLAEAIVREIHAYFANFEGGYGDRVIALTTSGYGNSGIDRVRAVQDAVAQAKESADYVSPVIARTLNYANAFCAGREIKEGGLQRWNTIHDAYTDVLLSDPDAREQFMRMHERERRQELI